MDGGGVIAAVHAVNTADTTAAGGTAVRLITKTPRGVCWLGAPGAMIGGGGGVPRQVTSKQRVLKLDLSSRKKHTQNIKIHDKRLMQDYTQQTNTDVDKT